MSARDIILSRIRARMDRSDEATRKAAIEKRLAEHPRNLVPARGQGDVAHRIRIFTAMMEAVGGTVEVLEDVNDVPRAVADYLRERNLPARIWRGGDLRLARLPWHRVSALTVEEGPAKDSDTASLTHAFAGVAETGTVVQLSGPENPTGLNFLPEAHIAVLEAACLHASYEEVWSMLRQSLGKATMPRTVNLISGPSRTADIEQYIVRPAHGPKHMHVMILRR